MNGASSIRMIAAVTMVVCGVAGFLASLVAIRMIKRGNPAGHALVPRVAISMIVINCLVIVAGLVTS